jgi:hypothetical protein
VINSNLEVATAKAVFDVAVGSGATTIVETCSNYIARNFGQIMKHAAAAMESGDGMIVEKPQVFCHV